MSARREWTDQEKLEWLLDQSIDDPAFFIENVLQPELGPRWKWQKRVCDEIRDQLQSGDRSLVRVLIRSCHGAGKTWLAAALVLWWSSTRPRARVLTLAQSWSGVENLIWPNIATLFNGSILRADPKIEMLHTELTFDRPSAGGKSEWYAIGASTDKPGRLEGHHSKVAAMRVVDEAKEVDEAIFTATEGMLDAPENFDLWISTPSINAGPFYDRDAGTEKCIRRAIDVDQLIADGVTEKQAWKDHLLEKWGPTDPEFLSRAMALYIDNIEGSLFPLSWVERAMAQTFEVKEPLIAGMDVAGSDDGDQNAVAVAAGPDGKDRLHVRELYAWNERDTMVSKGKAIAIGRDAGDAPYRVDATGLGKGVADSLREDEYNVEEYWAGGQPRDQARFISLKAEDNWFVRELLEKSLLRILAPSHTLAQQLKAQFSSIKFKVTQAGKIQVLKPSNSPDLVDSIVVACAGRRYSKAFGVVMSEEPEDRLASVSDYRDF